MRTHRGPTPKQRRETLERQSLGWCANLGAPRNRHEAIKNAAKKQAERMARMDELLERHCHD